MACVYSLTSGFGQFTLHKKRSHNYIPNVPTNGVRITEKANQKALSEEESVLHGQHNCMQATLLQRESNEKVLLFSSLEDRRLEDRRLDRWLV